MAVCSSLSAVSPYAVPKLSSKLSESRAMVSRSTQTHRTSELYRSLGKTRLSTRLSAAGFAEIEPDLREDPHDRWETNSISMDDFKFGEYDDHHTYHEGEEKKGSFWGSIAEDIEAVGTPTGFQGLISWLFLPAIAAGMYFNAPGEYLYIGAGLFTIVFCIIEMDKPDKPHNFEPQIYNMERGARDKLIADYNTMDIWDFNEKYGDLWDFTVTVKKEDIMKR
ncbi:photosynthetic NDH subunit of subcomplex B 5, chloroplastic [Pyrus x bretschneideri]|uniref:photosynthetic NDH subunit of subcomplex B 5, chloroplastic n=1 Tax=Pyrus x bretschneideri TaxID=225117 RepID=UPI002030177E|nr:photosynthetic NDH subunit of subcomplex B 5, chloroplastic [Pyrus x bretschneideri]